MRRLALAVALQVILASCGRVGAPQAPYLRIPQRIGDLSVSQNGYNVVLSWTNPALYVDGSTATDLTFVHITSNAEELAKMPPTGPGKPQSFTLPAQGWVGMPRGFNVWLQTRRGKISDVAAVTITPVEVPGAVVALKAVMDQYSLNLTWQPPNENPGLVGTYFVRRLDRTEPPATTTDLQWKDAGFEKGQEYTYEVVAARRTDNSFVAGPAAAPFKVVAIDMTAPQAPTGIQVTVTAAGAYVTWNANQELDLAGYRVFRNGEKVSETLQTGNSYFDENYAAGTTYSVSAVDESGNASPITPNRTF